MAPIFVRLLGETVLVLETMMILTQQVQQIESVVQRSIEYEYREAEYEYKKSVGRESAIDTVLKLCHSSWPEFRDPRVDVNVEAIQAPRFIARKPHGFGETQAPFASLGTEVQIRSSTPEARLRLATAWREKALKNWYRWYFSVRAFEDRGGLDELQFTVQFGK